MIYQSIFLCFQSLITFIICLIFNYTPSTTLHIWLHLHSTSFTICKQGYTYDFVIDFIHWYYCDSQGSFLDSSFPSPSDYTFWHKDFLVQQWYVQWDYQIELLLYWAVLRHDHVSHASPPSLSHTLFKINT